MNSVQLIGILTRNLELRYTTSQMAVATFSIALDIPTLSDRMKEFNVTIFGKQAENCEKYLAKGMVVAIQCSQQTSSYTNKNGDKMFVTKLVAESVEPIGWKDSTVS